MKISIAACACLTLGIPTPVDSFSPASHLRAFHRHRERGTIISMVWKQHGGPIDPSSCPLSQDEIQSRITSRNKARRARKFAHADEILADLNRNNVQLDDGKKLWRADGETFQRVVYRKAGNSKDISIKDEKYVMKKLEERTAAKLRKDYNVADDIVDELRFLMNVVVDDTDMSWRVTDPYKTIYTYGGQRLNNVPEHVLSRIEQLVKTRAEAKKSKDYGLADEILSQLCDYGVRVDDVKKAWFFLPRATDEKSPNEMEDKNSTKDMFKKDRKQQQTPASRDSAAPDWSIDEDDNAMPDGISVEVPLGIVSESDDEAAEGNTDNKNKKESTATFLESLTVPQLKERLREAGLPVSGRKAELINRLTDG